MYLGLAVSTIMKQAFIQFSNSVKASVDRQMRDTDYVIDKQIDKHRQVEAQTIGLGHVECIKYQTDLLGYNE